MPLILLFSLKVRQAIEGERFLDSTHVDAVGMGSGSFMSSQDQDIMIQPYSNQPPSTREEMDPNL